MGVFPGLVAAFGKAGEVERVKGYVVQLVDNEGPGHFTLNEPNGYLSLFSTNIY